MKIALLSDIHGNIHALREVVTAIEKKYDIDVVVLLGDLIDYGMFSNEVILTIEDLKYPIVCNIFGNHEDAIVHDQYHRFSSDRGRNSARNTKLRLNDHSWSYIREVMLNTGKMEFELEGKKVLAIHGSLEDEYWKAICIDQDLSAYESYDYVFSGHSHFPHFFEKYYKTDNPITRNKKKTIFINPGSVGQPRNINPCAQYAVLDTENDCVFMEKVMYDIKAAQAAFTDEVDVFYKKRLEVGV